MTLIEARAGRLWVPLGHGDAAPRIDETDDIELRGPAGTRFTVGGVDGELDHDGRWSVRPIREAGLAGHVGLLPVVGDRGTDLGEIRILPGKLSEPAYERLKADLQRVWTDLVFDPTGRASIAARPPASADLLARIDRPLRQILDQPAERLVTTVGVRRLDRVRHVRELRAAVVMAGQVGRPARTVCLARSIDTPERALVATTLDMLRSHARREDEGRPVVQRVERLLHEHFRGVPARPVTAFTWGMRSDPRYRRILHVHQVLNRLDLHPTEGPGELRLGVRGLPRLYEYWVYLKVLEAARERYGPPVGPGFDLLSIEQTAGRRRLELRAGTTVAFPGDVHIAFEPAITPDGRGWMGVEYVPHPEPRQSQHTATPDVAVLRRGSRPSLVVIDAKYVSRTNVERQASRLHEKYSRMRLDGTPIVERVYAAHPHHGYTALWAGYGHFGAVPGEPVPVSLPEPVPSARAAAGPIPADIPDRVEPARQPVPPPPPGSARAAERAPTSTSPPVPDRSTAIVVDQYWMYHELGGRRIDLGQLAEVVAPGRVHASCEIVMPRIDALSGFGTAVERRGWTIRWVDDTDRASQLSVLLRLASRRAESHDVVVVSGDPVASRTLDRPGVELFARLDDVPNM